MLYGVESHPVGTEVDVAAEDDPPPKPKRKKRCSQSLAHDILSGRKIDLNSHRSGNTRRRNSWNRPDFGSYIMFMQRRRKKKEKEEEEQKKKEEEREKERCGIQLTTVHCFLPTKILSCCNDHI
jgi:hypothetical protein